MLVFNGHRYGAPVLIVVTYTTVSGTIVESPANVWGPGVGYGLSTLKRAANTAATYQSDYLAANNRDVAIGWDPNNTNTNFTSFAYGMFVDGASGMYAVVTSGSPSLTSVNTAVAVGDQFRLAISAAGVVTAEYFRSGVWNIIHTFAATAAATIMYCKIAIASTPAYVTNPKGLNLV